MENILREDIVGFETAKLAKRAGYSNGTMLSYTHYNSTYVYDSSPDHPESYKRGEIRGHNRFFHENANFDTIAYYRIPTDFDNPDGEECELEFAKLNPDLIDGDILWEIFEAPSHSMLYKWIRKNLLS